MSALTFRTALVTGASAGLGAEFARELAASGTNLILVARRRERLAALAAELVRSHGVTVEVVPADLTRDEDLKRVERHIAAAETLDLLVNNAGFGGRDTFSKGAAEESLAMVDIHVTAPVRLTRAAVDGMIARRRGRIINVASVAAFSPLSGTIYSAVKAFLVGFSRNLRFELEGTGVRVQALCPGMTHTEFHEVIGMDKSIVPAFMWMTAPEVVRISLRALGRRRVVCVPGWKNRLLCALLRFAPTAALIEAVAALPHFRKKAGL